MTAYHCSIALMSTMNHFFFGRSVDSSDSLYHLSQAVSLVNQTLDTPEALSNANLSVVNFIVVHELLNGAQGRAEIHLKGLQQMIELRGGITELGDKMLMAKACK